MIEQGPEGPFVWSARIEWGSVRNLTFSLNG